MSRYKKDPRLPPDRAPNGFKLHDRPGGKGRKVSTRGSVEADPDGEYKLVTPGRSESVAPYHTPIPAPRDEESNEIYWAYKRLKGETQ